MDPEMIKFYVCLNVLYLQREWHWTWDKTPPPLVPHLLAIRPDISDHYHGPDYCKDCARKEGPYYYDHYLSHVSFKRGVLIDEGAV